MSLTDLIGYLASALVLATFCMRDMAALRWMAIASNLAFIGYGALADLGPVLMLHLLLLPLNLVRLREARGAARCGSGANLAGPAEQEPRDASKFRFVSNVDKPTVNFELNERSS